MVFLNQANTRENALFTVTLANYAAKNNYIKFFAKEHIEFKHFLDRGVYMGCYIFALTLTALFKYTSSYIRDLIYIGMINIKIYMNVNQKA